MARLFQLKRFLRYIDDELLLNFFEAQNITPELTEKGDQEKREDYWERIINGLDSNSFGKASIEEVKFQVEKMIKKNRNKEMKMNYEQPKLFIFR